MPTSSPDSNNIDTDEYLNDVDPNLIAMFGISGFQSSKNIAHKTSSASGARVIKRRKSRQYVNPTKKKAK